MDRQYIRDHQVIERYLSGILTADEEQAFEEAYLGDPELLAQLQTAERLREGLKDLNGAGRLPRLRPAAPWRQWLRSPQYAAAASVLLAVSLGFSTMLYRENRDLRDAGPVQGSAITRIVALEAVRGGAANEISASAQDELTSLLLDAGTVAYDTYRATLTRLDDEGPEQIFRRDDLVPQLGGSIVVSVAGRSFGPGDYEVRLEGRMNAWPTERFEEITRTPFTVIPRD
jgi:hypothetical protein